MAGSGDLYFSKFPTGDSVFANTSVIKSRSALTKNELSGKTAVGLSGGSFVFYAELEKLEKLENCKIGSQLQIFTFQSQIFGLQSQIFLTSVADSRIPNHSFYHVTFGTKGTC